MYKKILCLLMFCLMTVLQARFAFADDYSDCTSKCEQDKSDCLSEPQASEATEQTSKEAICTQRYNICNSICEKLRPRGDDSSAETPAPNPDAAPNPDTAPTSGTSSGGTLSGPLQPQPIPDRDALPESQ